MYDVICECWQCRGETEAPEWAEVREEDESLILATVPRFKRMPDAEWRALIEAAILAGTRE